MAAVCRATLMSDYCYQLVVSRVESLTMGSIEDFISLFGFNLFLNVFPVEGSNSCDLFLFYFLIRCVLHFYVLSFKS